MTSFSHVFLLLLSDSWLIRRCRLNWVPGILFRDANAQWQYYMGAFVQMMAALIEPHLARNGGPVILAQVGLSVQPISMLRGDATCLIVALD